ncbi:hypothetical protein Salat_0079000 [Sesamum alatum]|uniref:HAT C-terminal dimerisation domain-containing protein n=1 Tax=Sesamum alatum TaxID=300844 RepID=A0AAE2CWQ9_9LAMI|nr:hypothetical protein Salat_0079000 [Sesamum alatum]
MGASDVNDTCTESANNLTEHANEEAGDSSEPSSLQNAFESESINADEQPSSRVDDTSGFGLFHELLDALKSLDLNVDDVRGQSYDNGSNMKGKKQGVQTRLLEMNPRALTYFSSEASCPLRKKQYDETTDDEDVRSPEEAFEYDYFNVITDMAIASLRNRFEELQRFENIFGFLLDSKRLQSLYESELWQCCNTFHSTFSYGDKSDVDLNDLYSELKILQGTLPNKFMSAIDILEFVKTLDCFPNISITCRILLTVLMTVASAERSFSKLKLLKTYLRSSMSQERLNGLAILCIEKDMLGKIDVDSMIDDFASRNAR